MKLLKDILYGVSILEVEGSTNVAVNSITEDSRKAIGFSAFVACKGTQVDGHEYISNALETGSSVVICSKMPERFRSGVTYVKVKDSKNALGIIASNFYDNPSEKLKLVGITGTNGKTSVATLLYELFKSLGLKAGLISTVVNKINNTTINATHTTPDAIALNQLLAEMVKQGCHYCFMEVSSHALHQQRIAGIQFTGALFTNITHDHLDYHKTFDHYIATKKKLFDQLPPKAFALVNQDDKHADVMLHHTKAKKYQFALKTMADFKARVIENQFAGLHLSIDEQEIWLKLIGSFNAYNVLAVYAVARLLELEKITILTALSSLDVVDGRFEVIKKSGKIFIVDYAHTPDALKNVLATINDIRTGNEKLITVIGCGGNRDKEKRPVMAKIATTLSNQVIFTSDNPRFESPEQIINEMKSGVEIEHQSKVLTILDRAEAIKTAGALAQQNDIVLIAGKGHEKYQEIEGKRLPFDDKGIIMNYEL